jgi:hypothetical protein
MAEVFNFDFFQIPHTGVEEPDCEVPRDLSSDQRPVIRRALDSKISNFGALFVDARSTTDYTKTILYFANKDNSSDVNMIKPEWQYAERNENPLICGSTVKYVRDDQFTRMGMSTSKGAQIDEPKFDVMDTKERTPGGTNYTLKNWPTEGWHSFGGKYDGYAAYMGA